MGLWGDAGCDGAGWRGWGVRGQGGRGEGSVVVVHFASKVSV